ncbi:MAG: endo alpha-1,4 polygalactosaminidase [Candidatus Aminicenantes bacterium]|nr:MAG: endo alpha-1,4 polygalactosaminidase [Candidatus Aminicenantes bacterium]
MKQKNKKKPLFLLCAFLIGWGCHPLLCGLSLSGTDPLPLSSVRYWAYQIQDLDASGAVQKIVNSKYDLVVLDPMVTHDYTFDTKDMVNRIKASKASDGVHRKLVIAYIDIGQAEEWRWYWDGHTTYEEKGECKNSFVTAIQNWAPWVVACDPDGWAGNYPVAFWDDDWKDIVIYGTTLGSHLGLYFNSMLDEVIQDGFDGVYLDWVEAWEMTAVQNRAQNEGKDPGQEMLDFIKEMREYGKQYNPDFIVIQQNSSELINEVGANALKNAVDAIAQEGVWWDGDAIDDDWNNPDGYDQPSCCTNYYLTRLRKYKNAGFPVFVCDYAVQQADDVYQKAAAEGFIAYATRRPLSKLTTTPPDFVVIQTPIISIDRTQFYFGAIAHGNAPESRWFSISNSGEGTLNWNIIDNAAWLSTNPTSGIGSGQVTVSVDISGLDSGTYTGTITVSDPNASNSPQTVQVTLNVYDEGEDDDPFGSFDTPVEGSTVRSSVAVTGWVLDDVGIDSVKIYREDQESKDLFYIGEAMLVEGARTDIQQAYPTYPMSHKAGWGYMMLTYFLPNQGNGTFTLYAVAADVSGHSIILGTKTITCDNANAVKPFGAIDTPVQGGIASGSKFIVWGWVLTPQPNRISTDGSTINVYVDGVNLGHPTYNIYRADIADFFPSYANSNGAAGYFYLDTTAYEDGVHTIQWVVVDSAGNTDGIGSRYFIIRNTN